MLEDSPQDMSLDRKSTGIARGQPSGQVSRQEGTGNSSLGRYVFGSEISYNKAPPRLPGLGC